MTGPASPKATPKRKRDDLIVEQKFSSSAPESTTRPHTKTIFSFVPPSSSTSSEILEDGSSSPRSRVANKLRNLSLEGVESGGGVIDSHSTKSSTASLDAGGDPSNSPSYAPTAKPEPGKYYSPEPAIFSFDGRRDDNDAMEQIQVDDDDETSMRKRHKQSMLEGGMEIGANGESSAEVADSVVIGEDGRLTLAQPAVAPVAAQSNKTGSSGNLKKSYPSINRLADSRSRSRRRTGTPPLRRKSTGSVDEEAVIVDPVRAALTWHEDEITVYDAEDKDDDGTGLNGIGFKPTAAVAYQRAQKRKQQLSEYRKREESEARARRNQKRREQLGAGSKMERRHSMVKVHFSETEPEAVVLT